MRTLGIIGGVGPESTIEYYRRILARARAERPDLPAPSVVINSVENRKVLDLAGAGQLAELSEYLATEIERLARAGAGLAVIAANTPHLVFDEVKARVSIPLLSIVEATCRAAQTAGARRLALLGTRFTMEGRFYPENFARAGIELVIPEPDEQRYVHEKYMSELLAGIIQPETQARLIAIVQAMKERARIGGVILGGTELSLILREPTVAGLPVFDTTQIHVDAAVAWLSEET